MIGKKVGEFDFKLLLLVFITWCRSSRASTNVTVTLLFTLDVTPPTSQADRLFSIAFTAQWREVMSCAEESRRVGA